METWCGTPPEICNLCQLLIDEGFIDGQLAQPPHSWAILCPKCHKENGRGLGPGLGQLYQKIGDVFVKIENRSIYPTVWHAKNPTFGIGEGTTRFPRDFELVAKVDAETLEEVFAITNQDNWWDNDKVIAYKKTRTTSVGDVVVMNGGKDVYLCLFTGWKRYLCAPRDFPINLLKVQSD